MKKNLLFLFWVLCSACLPCSGFEGTESSAEVYRANGFGVVSEAFWKKLQDPTYKLIPFRSPELAHLYLVARKGNSELARLLLADKKGIFPKMKAEEVIETMAKGRAGCIFPALCFAVKTNCKDEATMKFLCGITASASDQARLLTWLTEKRSSIIQWDLLNGRWEKFVLDSYFVMGDDFLDRGNLIRKSKGHIVFKVKKYEHGAKISANNCCEIATIGASYCKYVVSYW